MHTELFVWLIVRLIDQIRLQKNKLTLLNRKKTFILSVRSFFFVFGFGIYDNAW